MLSGERLAEQGALLGQQVDATLHVAELVGEPVKLGGHLGFNLDRPRGIAAMLCGLT